MVRDDVAEVPGAALRFRLTGKAGKYPLIVMENGWGASYDYFALLQARLAAKTQVLLYNRAGVGGSIAREPQTVEGMSRHLSALLDHLDIRDPVVVLGQSYGGLICGVHAALIPERLRAIVQVDPTPERADPTIDAGLGTMPLISNLLIGLAMLRVPEPIFGSAMPELPEEANAAIRKYAFGNAESLRASKKEFALLPVLRAVCAAATETTRLVISASRIEPASNPLLRMMISQKRTAVMNEAKHALHQATARRGAGSAFVSLPHTHGGVVCTKSGAADTATSTFGFLSTLSGKP
jgi:pimeloyl-ACP methyl ester carboxylesterase